MKGEKEVKKNKEITRVISIENAKIVFRNFSGKPGRYNPDGYRNFSVLLDKDIASELEADGWNVRYLIPKDSEDAPQAYLQVAVKYANFPPRVVVISGTGKSVLDEDNISILDWAEIENVDLIIRPYNWEMNGKFGVKAYLKSIYVTLFEDEFAKKYRDVPDSARSSIDEEPPF